MPKIQTSQEYYLEEIDKGAKEWGNYHYESWDLPKVTSHSPRALFWARMVKVPAFIVIFAAGIWQTFTFWNIGSGAGGYVINKNLLQTLSSTQDEYSGIILAGGAVLIVLCLLIILGAAIGKRN